MACLDTVKFHTGFILCKLLIVDFNLKFMFLEFFLLSMKKRL